MSITVRLQGDKALQRKISKFHNKLKNPKKILKESGELLVKNYQTNFQTEGSTLGSKWKPLSAFTTAQKIRLGYGGKKILERTGKLMKSIKILILNKFLVKVGSKLDYYRYHQSAAPRRKLPRRKMVDITNKLSKQIADIFRKNLFKGFTR